METFKKTIKLIFILSIVFALIGVLFTVVIPSLIIGIDYKSTREVSGNIIAVSPPELLDNELVVKIFWESPGPRIMSGGYIWEPYEFISNDRWVAIYSPVDKNIPTEWLGKCVNKEVRMNYFIDSLDYRVHPVRIEILK
jgi:hypothetical protein